MRRWRLPLLLTAAVILGQLFRTTPLVDVVTGRADAGVRLVFPLAHVLFAPFTLLADWLNGGSRADLVGFALWAFGIYALARVLGGRSPRRPLREAAYAALFVAAVASFVAWGALLPRPIPRLAATDSALIVFDVHSHTAASHDGRPGFTAAANARWHARAGFDAAFVTDHNTFGATDDRQRDAAGRAAWLLPGEELSLSGLHILVLGNTAQIENRPWNGSFDSSLALLRRVAGDTTSRVRPYLVASLPEYWKHRWGTDIGAIVAAGVEGFEIWTTSPKAMDVPPAVRREVIARAKLEGLGRFGATDMHGLGNAATVWNVARLPRWREMDDAALARTLIALFRERGPEANRVLALRRWQPEGRAAVPAAIPVNLLLLLRTASPRHAAALLLWTWVPVLLLSLRRPPPRS